MTARRTRSDDVARLRAENADLRAVTMVLSARLTAVEALVAKLVPGAGLVDGGAEYCTIKQAAAALGMSGPGVHYQVGRGKLKARKVGGAVLVERASLENFMRNKVRGRS